MTPTSRLWSKVMGILVVPALLFLLLSGASASDSGQPLKLTILHMNDAHAHYLPYKEKGASGPIGGFAKAQSIIKDVETADRAEGRETLVFLAGDLLMGTPFSTVFKGLVGVTLLNRMGFTAMCAGNHEFDYGQENLIQKLKGAAQFPILSANIVSDAGDYVFQRTMEKRFPGSDVRVLIVGLTTPQTPITTHPGNVKGLVFKDPVETTKEILQGVQPDDLVIALTHLGLQEDKRLAEACPRVNVIIGGHSHTEIPEPLKVNETLICQAGAYAKFMGRLDLDFAHGKILRYQGRLIPLDENVKEDPAVASVIADYKLQLDGVFNGVIGKTEVFLEGNGRNARPGETVALARIVTFNMATSSGSEAAVINAGTIRKSINEGNITSGDVYTALPFSDTVVRLGLTGEDLLTVLQRGASLEPGSGGKLQTSGIAYRVDNGRVAIDSVGGKLFGPEKVYSIATNDFLAAGGDGYSIIKERGQDPYPTAMPISDLVIDSIKKAKVITKEVLDGLQ